tara:strand:- start:778 stop:1059 length:282 start_codon:yes stop_codon:yes gene_type:complete
MPNCNFCQNPLDYEMYLTGGSCFNHDDKIVFYTDLDLIEFFTKEYILAHYPDRIVLMSRLQVKIISDMPMSISVTPDSLNSIIDKIIKYNVFC